jgi:death-on-curing protein
METEPIFLSLDQVLRLHNNLIEVYGGDAGTRDLGLLQSAIAMPQSTFDGTFLHTDLFEMGAAYLFHIVQNHPFGDGNKRTGAASAIIFLRLNGISIKADEAGLVEITLQTATGKADKSEIAEFFRRSQI